MRKLDNTYVSELEFEDSGMRGPKGESGDSPSLRTEKVAPFLYKIESGRLNDDAAELFVKKHFPEADTSCAAIRTGNLFGHNYDAQYDEMVEFIVKTHAAGGRHGSIGMAAIPNVLTEEMMSGDLDDADVKEALEVVPFFAVDGMNDAGVCVAMNRMPEEVTDDLSDDSGKCALFAVRYLLDYADSADHAVKLIKKQDFWWPTNEDIKAGFCLLISDGTKSIVADLEGNKREITDEEQNGNFILPAILTNFRTIEWDGTDETLEKHANGLERFNILNIGMGSVNSAADLIALLKSVRYTGIYNTSTSEPWLSDFNGDWTDLGFGDLTIDSYPDEYTALMNYEAGLFAERTRDGATMHTMHTVVYDTELQTMVVLVQEEDDEYRFCMDALTLLSLEEKRAKAAEQAIRDDFAETYYPKHEVDEKLETLEENILETVGETYYTKEESNEKARELQDEISRNTDEKLKDKADVPENTGETGQILYKTQEGSAWDNLPPQLPEVTVEDDNKVMAVENGEWVATDKFADYFRYVNLTVTITSDNGGVPTSGLTVTVKDESTGDLINQAEYEGQPVTFRVPRGMSYIIEQSGKWEGYHNPTPDKVVGAATHDSSTVFTYEAIKVPETLRELQIIVESGSASSLKNHIGLQFEDTYVYEGETYDIIWDLRDVITVYDNGGNAHTAVILEWHYATLESMPFDAPERLEVDLATEATAKDGIYYYGQNGTTVKLLELNQGDALPTTYEALYKNAIRNADGQIVRRGYARYDECAPRKWLNSDQPAGQWWFSSHIGDLPPAQAETLAGFMCGCSEQILSMAKPIRVRTAISATEVTDTFDTFFLPSVAEVYGLSHAASEGEPFEDWIDATGMASPSNEACEGRKIYAIGSYAAQEIGLRSENVGYQYVTWDIKANGSIDGYVNASVVRRFAPCCAVYN